MTYRILHMGLSGQYAGTETAIMNLYRKIDREKYQFDFLVDADVAHPAFEEEIGQLGGRIFRVLYPRSVYPLAFIKRTNIKAIREIIRSDSRIVGVHMNLNSLYTLDGILAAEKEGLPIRIVHSHASHTTTHGLFRIAENAFSTMYLAHLKHHPAGRLACSEMAGKYMFHEQAFTVLHNGIDTGKFAFDKEKRKTVRHELNIEDRMVLGYVGRLSEIKNPLFLVEILNAYRKRNPKAVLLVTGDGEMRDVMERRVNECGLRDQVFFLGVKQDTAPYYSAMDCFLLPSFYEGFSLVMAEAQANGLPCVMSDAVPSEVMITDYVMKAPLRDSEIWCERIDEVIGRMERGLSFYDRFVKNHFDQESAARKLEEIYDRMRKEER